MKKFMVIVMMVLAMAGGFYLGSSDIMWTHDWEYERGIGQTEVRADFDDVNDEGKVYTEVLIWDEEFEKNRVVENGYVEKTSLDSMCEYAHQLEDSYSMRAMF